MIHILSEKTFQRQLVTIWMIIISFYLSDPGMFSYSN